MKTIITLLLTILTLPAIASEITGKVWDNHNGPIPCASLMVYQGNKLISTAQTDFDGSYLIKSLNPGYYDLIALGAGCDSVIITSIVVVPGKQTTQDFVLLKAIGAPRSIKMKYYTPILDGNGQILTKEEIQIIPTTEIIGIEIREADLKYTMIRIEPPISVIRPSTYVVTRAGIDQMPYMNTRDIPSVFPGMYQQRRSGDLSISGSKM